MIQIVKNAQEVVMKRILGQKNNDATVVPENILTAKYSGLSDAEKIEFISKFCKFNSSYQTKNGRRSTGVPFDLGLWNGLTTHTQLEVLQSLSVLQKTGLKIEYIPTEKIIQQLNKMKFITNGSLEVFAEFMIPLMINRIFSPGIKSEMASERRMFLEILAYNPSFADYIQPEAFRLSSIMDIERFTYSRAAVMTLLNCAEVEGSLTNIYCLLKTNLAVNLLKLRFDFSIESTYFEYIVIAACKIIIENQDYDLAIRANGLKSILDYLTSGWLSYAAEDRMASAIKKELIEHSKNNRQIAEAINYQNYGITLHNEIPLSMYFNYYVGKAVTLVGLTYATGTLVNAANAYIAAQQGPKLNI